MLLASVCIGVACACAAGFATGHPPVIRFPVRRSRAAISSRQLWLQQAGVALTPRQFWAGSFGVGLFAFTVLVVATGTPTVAVVPAIAIAGMPRAFFARRRSSRLAAVQEAWPDGLRDILASVSAGRPVTHALNSLVDSGPEPLRVAFARFPLLARMLGTVPALEIIKEELANPSSDRVIEVLILAHERGGRIVKDILEDLVASTTRDLKVQQEIATDGLEMQINARAVVCLPWLVLLALTFSDGPFRDFYRSQAGLLVVLVGGAMSAFGYTLISRLGRNLTEDRVFGSAAALGPADAR
ncbi:MAG: Flp pilus assembly protein TadB [Actinomycetia bacterium]|nr:Flp pilus assembly protein TadB [Actinomycetes bacterium]